ncbi:TPA: hypothetical protein ACQZCR_003213, partial [Escherichia coli]
MVAISVSRSSSKISAINFLDIATDCQGHRGGPFDHAFIELQRRFLMPGHKATELKPVALAQ